MMALRFPASNKRPSCHVETGIIVKDRPRAETRLTLQMCSPQSSQSRPHSTSNRQGATTSSRHTCTEPNTSLRTYSTRCRKSSRGSKTRLRWSGRVSRGTISLSPSPYLISLIFFVWVTPSCPCLRRSFSSPGSLHPLLVSSSGL
jgi:hypothetical protein